MSVSTIVAVVKRHEIDNFMLEVIKCLEKTFGEKLIKNSIRIESNKSSYENHTFKSMYFSLDYYNDSFVNKKENRILSISHDSDIEMKRDFYMLSTNQWGHNKEIANGFVDYFGGFANYSDCDNVEIDYCKSELQSFLGLKSE